MIESLIIGASGLVGGALFDVLKRQGSSVMGTYKSNAVEGFQKLDITLAEEVIAVFENLKPSVIYFPASMTNVDYCEQHPEESYLHNVEGVRNVVRAAKEIKAELVYFSSDYIFDGKRGPYSEEDPASPISVYGLQKLIAEHFILSYDPKSLIIRTTGVFGWERQGKNFICRLRNLLRTNQNINVPKDQIATPAYAPNLAEITVALVRQSLSGIYHVAGPACISRYEFARTAAKVFELNPNLIKPILTKDLGQQAQRPLNAGLKVDKAKQQVKIPLLSYREGLEEMKADQEKV